MTKLPLVDVSDVDSTEDWFAKHGAKAVFFGRMIPIFRSLISIPAGIERMPLPKFTLLTTLGSLVWNTALIMAGFLLGEQWHLVEEYLGVVSTGVLVLVDIAIAWFVVSKLTKREQGSHDHVRLKCGDGVHQRTTITHGGNDLVPFLGQQPHQSRTQQRRVLSQDHPHGNSATTTVGPPPGLVTENRPSNAATRRANPANPLPAASAPPHPSSSTRTSRTPSSSAGPTDTTIPPAPECLAALVTASHTTKYAAVST